MARYNAGLIPASPTVVSGVTAFGTHVNPFLTAVLSGFAGTTRSDGVAAGHVWSKEVAGGYEVNMFVGSSTDVPMGTVTTATGSFALPIGAIETALTSSGRGVPTGTLIMHAANTAPTGYLKCNGAAVSRTTYAALFSAIGTTYGVGNGTTTFNLPDMRGEFPRGWDDGRGVDSGRAFGSAQAALVGEHDHATPYSKRNGFGNLLVPTGGSPFGSQALPVDGISTFGRDRLDVATSDPAVTAQLDRTSGPLNQTGDNRPRNIATLFCIKF